MIFPAITIRQPWAALIVNGIKDVENRNWRLPDKYRNCTVLVHASAAPKFSISDLNTECARRGVGGKGDVSSLSILTGAIIGALRFDDDLLAYTHNPPSLWADYNHNDGKLHWWTIAHAQVIPPIPAKGKLRFWEFDYPYKIVWP